MGKFDGFLICSDIDGTFSGKGDTIPVNKKAIEYFIKEGGKFTFATGRNADYLLNSEFHSIINAPACLLNGSIIYDYKEEKVLCEKRLPFSVKDFTQKVAKYHGSDMSITVYNGWEDSFVSTFTLEDIPDSILGSTPLKIVCRFSTVKDADEFKAFSLNEKLFENCYISKSWSVGVEFNSSEGTKGTAIEFIKNYLRDIHIAVGIGDYENDIPMLISADLGVSVGNGLDEVKAVSDVVVKRNDEYAVKDLIEILNEQRK
ncbi:MAG: HAD hydrolase family protein [Clostridia bacterium]|nr:HAD hydrolase family protein [Clostridia bacterium]